jgi:hypothetical protein
MYDNVLRLGTECKIKLDIIWIAEPVQHDGAVARKKYLLRAR